MASSRDKSPAQKFKYFLVLDFEAQCKSGEKIQPQEIIEFPCLMIDSENFQILHTFHQYIKPVCHPQLTDFCTELTGITQDMVEDCPTWAPTLASFQEWYSERGLSTDNAAFVTCGLWDLATCLPAQCRYSEVAIPPMLDLATHGQFINLKFSFQRHTGKYGKGLKDMQRVLGLNFDGRLHSGIDDCKNIVKIMTELSKQGFVFEHNAQR